MQWGCDKADSCSWNSFIMASPDGVPLYTKFDFRAVGQVQTTWYIHKYVSEIETIHREY
jgi:hypothetical protein